MADCMRCRDFGRTERHQDHITLIIEDNTGGDPAGPDECGALYQRHDGTWDMEYPCVLEPGHLVEHEDERGEVWA